MATHAPLSANFIVASEIGFAMALSLFAICKRELLHYHAELMRGRANTAGTLKRETPHLGGHPGRNNAQDTSALAVELSLSTT